jgi:hypothetical protein
MASKQPTRITAPRATPSAMRAHEAACLALLGEAILHARLALRSAPTSDPTVAAYQLLDAIHNLPAAVASDAFWEEARVVDTLDAYDQLQAQLARDGYTPAKALLPIYQKYLHAAKSGGEVCSNSPVLLDDPGPHLCTSCGLGIVGSLMGGKRHDD